MAFLIENLCEPHLPLKICQCPKHVCMTNSNRKIFKIILRTRNAQMYKNAHFFNIWFSRAVNSHSIPTQMKKRITQHAPTLYSLQCSPWGDSCAIRRDRRYVSALKKFVYEKKFYPQDEFFYVRVFLSVPLPFAVNSFCILFLHFFHFDF
jgi:hypothetical protein